MEALNLERAAVLLLILHKQEKYSSTASVFVKLLTIQLVFLLNCESCQRLVHPNCWGLVVDDLKEKDLNAYVCGNGNGEFRIDGFWCHSNWCQIGTIWGQVGTIQLGFTKYKISEKSEIWQLNGVMLDGGGWLYMKHCFKRCVEAVSDKKKHEYFWDLKTDSSKKLLTDSWIGTNWDRPLQNPTFCINALRS